MFSVNVLALSNIEVFSFLMWMCGVMKFDDMPFTSNGYDVQCISVYLSCLKITGGDKQCNLRTLLGLIQQLGVQPSEPSWQFNAGVAIRISHIIGLLKFDSQRKEKTVLVLIL